MVVTIFIVLTTVSCVLGLGYEISKYLALLGARVIIASENEIRAKAVSLNSLYPFLA